jgi:hypothetical protein
MSAGSSKGGGLPKHRSLPNDNLSTDLGELNSAGWTRARAARRGGGEVRLRDRPPACHQSVMAVQRAVTRSVYPSPITH